MGLRINSLSALQWLRCNGLLSRRDCGGDQ